LTVPRRGREGLWFSDGCWIVNAYDDWQKVTVKIYRSGKRQPQSPLENFL
jgi:hypothetical protein